MNTSNTSQNLLLDNIIRVCNKLRSAHWNNKKFHSKQYADKEYRAGLELDKLLREVNQQEKLPAQANNND